MGVNHFQSMDELADELGGLAAEYRALAIGQTMRREIELRRAARVVQDAAELSRAGHYDRETAVAWIIGARSTLDLATRQWGRVATPHA